MSDASNRIQTAEDFVRNVLEKTFGQRVNEEQVRNAAEKIARNLPTKTDAKKAA